MLWGHDGRPNRGRWPWAFCRRYGARAAPRLKAGGRAPVVDVSRCLMGAGRDGLPGALEAAKANRATDRVVDVLRAAVSAGTTTDATWAAPLVAYQAISAGFLESLKSASAFQAILSAGAFRVVPFRLRVRHRCEWCRCDEGSRTIPHAGFAFEYRGRTNSIRRYALRSSLRCRMNWRGWAGSLRSRSSATKCEARLRSRRTNTSLPSC